MNLNDAKVLVTGGSSGIGLETARLLIENGARVAICARNAERLEAASSSTSALAIRADVSVESDVKRMVERVISEFSDYNVLINNAAYGYMAPLVDVDLEAFQKLMAVNVFGAMMVARESAKHFIKRDSGSIINISSTAGSRGYASGTPYVASKFALGGMTQCWAAELRRNNIRVMQINPSEVLTRFAENYGRVQELSEKKLRAIEIAHMIKSVLEMDDRGFVPDLTVWATNPF